MRIICKFWLSTSATTHEMNKMVSNQLLVSCIPLISFCTTQFGKRNEIFRFCLSSDENTNLATKTIRRSFLELGLINNGITFLFLLKYILSNDVSCVCRKKFFPKYFNREWYFILRDWLQGTSTEVCSTKTFLFVMSARWYKNHRREKMSCYITTESTCCILEDLCDIYWHTFPIFCDGIFYKKSSKH